MEWLFLVIAVAALALANRSAKRQERKSRDRLRDAIAQDPREFDRLTAALLRDCKRRG